VRPFLDEAAGVPFCLPIVWRIFAQQRRTFNAGNGNGRDDDYMCGARRLLEHRKATIETVCDVDLGARKRHADALVGWQTDGVDDDPQSAPVGCKTECGTPATVAKISPMVAAKLVTLCKRNSFEKLLIAGLKQNR
jgi:hypothetical protein